MIEKEILQRRAAILGHWPSISQAANELGMRPERLSRIIWNRVKPKPEEKRLLSWKLQRSIDELF